MLRPYLLVWAIYMLYVVLTQGKVDYTVAAYLVFFGLAWVFITRIQNNFEIVHKSNKPRRSKKVKDDIPDDPTWDQLRATLGRMAQGPTTQAQPSGPVQYTLWGTPEPIHKPEQLVRSSVPEEPEWFSAQFKR